MIEERLNEEEYQIIKLAEELHENDNEISTHLDQDES